MNIQSFLNYFGLTSWAESSQLEWKVSTRQSKELVQSLVAFANTSGGVVVCGVDDDGRIQGQDVSDGTIREITQTVLANTEERLYPVIERRELEGQTVLVASITESPRKPHLAYGRPYLRVGASNVVMDQPQYHLLLGQKHNGGGADRDVCPSATIADIDESKFLKFVERANDQRHLNLPPFADIGDILTTLELMQNGCVTKGALLLFGKEPQKHIPQSEFRLAHFRDEKRDVFLAQRVIGGTLFDQFEAVTSFALERLPSITITQGLFYGSGAGEAVGSGFFDGTGSGAPLLGDRVLKKIPLSVIQELVCNAIVHRDYRDESSSYLNIIGDLSFELSNPGLLPSPKITPETIHLPHPSVPINRRIAKAFFLAGLIEQWGEGTRRVCRELQERSMAKPAWFSERGEVRVLVGLTSV